MVAVRGYCVDRFESQLLDKSTGVALSPDYPSTPRLVAHVLSKWSSGRFSVGNLPARALPLPPLLRAASAAPKVRASNQIGVIPSGYTNSHVAKAACEAAGKRLCTHDEWRTACRGEKDRKFPYGDSYSRGSCNVFRYQHPAALLHGNAALGHLDPRLNRTRHQGKPLLKASGTTPRCASRWGNDAIYDMVGNLDEWVDKKGGAFAGGFYARSTRKGCNALITVHPRRYLDYSLGTRCCLTQQPLK